MTKSKDVTIIQICQGEGGWIFGLGDDQRVYEWNKLNGGTWNLFANEEEVA